MALVEVEKTALWTVMEQAMNERPMRLKCWKDTKGKWHRRHDVREYMISSQRDRILIKLAYVAAKEVRRLGYDAELLMSDSEGSGSLYIVGDFGQIRISDHKLPKVYTAIVGHKITVDCLIEWHTGGIKRSAHWLRSQIREKLLLMV